MALLPTPKCMDILECYKTGGQCGSGLLCSPGQCQCQYPIEKLLAVFSGITVPPPSSSTATPTQQYTVSTVQTATPTIQATTAPVTQTSQGGAKPESPLVVIGVPTGLLATELIIMAWRSKALKPEHIRYGLTATSILAGLASAIRSLISAVSEEL
jgi:hypothetical protein